MREADQHNTALLAREAEEARARLRRLKQKSDALGTDGRLSRDASPTRERKRQRTEEKKSERPRRESVERYRSKRVDGDEKRRRRSDEPGSDEKPDEKRRERRHDSRERRRTTDRRRETRHRRRGSSPVSTASSRSRSRSPIRRIRDCSREQKLRRHRSVSHSRSRSISPVRYSSRKDRKRDHKSSRYPPSHESDEPSKHIATRAKSISSKKPLNDTLSSQLSTALRQKCQPSSSSKLPPYRSPSPSTLSRKSNSSSDDIGPYLPSRTSSTAHTTLPPPRIRGRGAVNGESAMTARFNPSYDPTIDVQPDEDTDDWDMALEAMRDRQRWKQQGAERLRSAGFNDSFIKAWETNTTKDENKIKWKTKEESGGREWDRGKVVDGETGEVNLKAAWAK